MGNKNQKTKLKRLTAFVFDIVSIMFFVFTVYMALGLVFRIDSAAYQNLMFYLIPVIVIFYVFFGEILLKTTLGKYLTGIEVVDNDKLVEPLFMNYIKRGLLKILWPVEGIVLLLSKSDKRLGDLWANTIVVDKESNYLTPLWRTVTGIVVIVALFFAFSFSMGFAVKKTAYYNAGLDYLKTTSGVVEVGLTRELNQSGNKVDFVVPVSGNDKGKYVKVYLENTGGKWNVYNADFFNTHIGSSFTLDISAEEDKE